MQHVKNPILRGLIHCGLVSVMGGIHPLWAATDSVPTNSVPVINPAPTTLDAQNQLVPPALSAPTPITYQDQPFNSPSATLTPLVPPQDPVNQQIINQNNASQASIEQAQTSPAVIPREIAVPEKVVGPDVSNQIAQYHDQAVNALQPRLQPYLKNTNPAIGYQAQKANMWLLYAANKGSERGLTTARKEALQQATTIINGLEQNQTLSTTTPILSVSKVMRRDLWANTELLKQHAGFECSTSEVAQAEVMLVWAAAEHCELGWRHSRELFASAERLVDKASYQAFNCKAGLPQQLAKVSYPSLEALNGNQSGCHGVVGQWPLVSPVAPVVAVAETKQAEPEAIARAVLPNTVHFALDQASLSERSKAVLDQVINELKIHPDYAVTLYGYTDSRASVAYNQALSKRRADTVERYLNAQGIVSSRIATVAAGKTKVIADADKIIAHALSRRVELVFASSDGQEILTEAQRADLQPER